MRCIKGTRCGAIQPIATQRQILKGDVRGLVEFEDASLHSLAAGISNQNYIGRISCSRRNGQRGRSRQSRKSPQAVGTQVNAALELQGDRTGDAPALNGLKGGG